MSLLEEEKFGSSMGLTKKSQQTPPLNIEVAKKRLKEIV
jgi:hypothetical protein